MSEPEIKVDMCDLELKVYNKKKQIYKLLRKLLLEAIANTNMLIDVDYIFNNYVVVKYVLGDNGLTLAEIYLVNGYELRVTRNSVIIVSKHGADAYSGV